MSTSPQRRIDVAGLVIALILLVLAGLVWWDMSKLQILSPYDLGPKVMPIVVSGGLGAACHRQRHRGACAATCPPATASTGRPIILILGGLAA